MNKYQRAIKWLGQYIDNDCYTKNHQNVCKLAIEVLEKATPKHPYLYGDGYSNGELIYDMWDCPNCGASYEVECDKYDYCPHCGQRILWEDWS